MLRLAREKSGKLVNKWIPDFDLDKFTDDEIMGPALVDESGEFINGDWIDLVDGKLVVNEKKKEQAIAKEKSDAAAERAARENRRAALVAKLAEGKALSAKTRTTFEQFQLLQLLADLLLGENGIDIIQLITQSRK